MAGAFGVLRLPDFFTRLHAAGMTDTLGAEMIILGPDDTGRVFRK